MRSPTMIKNITQSPAIRTPSHNIRVTQLRHSTSLNPNVNMVEEYSESSSYSAASERPVVEKLQQ